MTAARNVPTLATWAIPLSTTELTLAEAHASLGKLALRQEQVPFLVQLVENPRYDLPAVDLFHGASDLRTHDYIHILLGRGLKPKDEAFVLGFTMGSTNRVTATEERLYGLFARYLYPKAYRFSDDDMQVFKDAVRLAYVSDCRSLAEADYQALLPLRLPEAREALGIETDLLAAYYRIERKRYPRSMESQRLLDQARPEAGDR